MGVRVELGTVGEGVGVGVNGGGGTTEGAGVDVVVCVGGGAAVGVGGAVQPAVTRTASRIYKASDNLENLTMAYLPS